MSKVLAMSSWWALPDGEKPGWANAGQDDAHSGGRLRSHPLQRVPLLSFSFFTSKR